MFRNEKATIHFIEFANLPPGHRVADGFRWADRDASA
jgi:hypothetical protein